MRKILFFLLISTVVFAIQPKSVHWSAFGKYLVDQDGNKTKIEGHPLMACYQGPRTIRGKFLKEIKGIIYLMIDYKTIVQINKPVCDILE